MVFCILRRTDDKCVLYALQTSIELLGSITLVPTACGVGRCIASLGTGLGHFSLR
jgi:hypothetical protein